ncbi:hypothetical protein [Desulfotruncus arcticus]|nr:hypothetical protein [Desulfotruncus arcticus]
MTRSEVVSRFRLALEELVISWVLSIIHAGKMNLVATSNNFYA